MVVLLLMVKNGRVLLSATNTQQLCFLRLHYRMRLNGIKFCVVVMHRVIDLIPQHLPPHRRKLKLFKLKVLVTLNTLHLMVFMILKPTIMQASLYSLPLSIDTKKHKSGEMRSMPSKKSTSDRDIDTCLDILRKSYMSQSSKPINKFDEAYEILDSMGIAPRVWG